MTKADILILISACNGADRLPRVLAGYERQVDPGVSWSLVVVDNASTDRTPDVLESFRERLPLVILKEPVAGKNRALNAALRQVEGRLVIFSDDDAIPNDRFVLEWSKVLDRFEEFELFGGKVVLLFDAARPEWLNPDVLPFDILYAANDRLPGEIGPGEIFGPNMAVRGQVFSRGMRFDEAIGPNKTDSAYPMGSETEFCKRVAAEGGRCCFIAGPEVDHIVRPNQMEREFVLGRAKRYGRGRARVMLLQNRYQPKINIPGLRFLPHNLRQVLRWCRKRVSRTSERMRLDWELHCEGAHYAELKARFR